MKKVGSLLLTAAITLSCTSVFLVGCGDDSISDYEHTIVFYSSQGQDLQKVTEEAIKRFEVKYPGWKVSHQVPSGGYDGVKEKVMSDLQANEQPDLAYCYADHVAQYLSSEQVINMSTLIGSDATVSGVEVITGQDGSLTAGEAKDYAVGYTNDEIADFVKGFYEEGKAHNYSGYADYGYAADSMLTLPFVKSTELLYYNASALEKLDLEVPETWDDLWAQAPAIKKAYPKATVLGYDSEANWFITMCEQNGWGYTSAEGNNFRFNENNADLQAWLNKLNDYYEDGWLTTQEDYGSYTSGLFTKGVANDAGGIVYCIGSSGGASHQSPGDLFNAKIAPIPGTMKDGKINNSAISQGPSLVMLKAGYDVSNADEKAKMTFLFVKELLDPTFQAQFSIKAGYNPCRESVYEIEAYKEHMTGDSMTAMACNAAKIMSDRFFTSPAFVGSSTARTQVGNVLY
ncbi:MAG: extracellular solute-binding protein, partial [Clostridia bacterium]|nr:extracellular solute-binding protein [Clostridia bacterium]